MQPNKSTAEWPLISSKPYLRYYNTQHQLKIIVKTRSLANICRAEALTQLYFLALTINQPLLSHSVILLCTTHTHTFLFVFPLNTHSLCSIFRVNAQSGMLSSTEVMDKKAFN